jgi:glucosamine--fructose-6-phosphate aminotransferase (isomerizing)
MTSSYSNTIPAILDEIRQASIVIQAINRRGKEITDKLKDFLKDFKDKSALHVGCGSSYYAASFGAYSFFSQTGKGVALPASEFLYLLDQSKPAPVSLSILYSRSGETAEIVAALKKAKKSGVKIIGVTCSEGSTLHKEADLSIAIPECSEKSYYMTKSFIALSILGTLTSYSLQNINSTGGEVKLEEEFNKFIQGIEKIYEKYDELKELARRTLSKSYFIVLSSEYMYPIAQEASLKLIEIAYTFAQPMYALEFRHGPIALREKSKELQLVALSGSVTASNAYVEKLLDELESKGIHALLISDNNQADFKIPIRISSSITSLLLILPMYIFAVERAIQLGYNPDKPLHIQKVISTI